MTWGRHASGLRKIAWDFLTCVKNCQRLHPQWSLIGWCYIFLLVSKKKCLFCFNFAQSHVLVLTHSRACTNSRLIFLRVFFKMLILSYIYLLFRTTGRGTSHSSSSHWQNKDRAASVNLLLSCFISSAFFFSLVLIPFLSNCCYYSFYSC